MPLSDRELRTLKELEDTLRVDHAQRRSAGHERFASPAIRILVGGIVVLLGLGLVLLGMRADDEVGVAVAVVGYLLVVAVLNATLPHSLTLLGVPRR